MIRKGSLRSGSLMRGVTWISELASDAVVSLGVGLLSHKHD